MSPAIIPFVITMISIAACAPGKGAFLTVQTCVRDDREVVEFRGIMRRIADREGMEFVEGSEKVRREFSDLRRLGGSPPTLSEPVLYLVIQNPKGVGLVAANIGLPAHQITVGFLTSRDSAEDQKFAGEVIDALSEHWRIETIPKGSGALPMESCK